MANNKWIAALAVGSVVCLTMLGMRTQAAPGKAALPAR